VFAVMVSDEPVARAAEESVGLTSDHGGLAEGFGRLPVAAPGKPCALAGGFFEILE
jgi:hypothetical protein